MRYLLLVLLLCGVSRAQSESYERVYSPWHITQICSLDWSARAQLIGSLSIDGQLFLWRDGGSSPFYSILFPDSPKSFDLSPDGERLVVVFDERVEVYRVGESIPEVTLRGHDQEIVRAMFDPAGRALATSSKDRTVRLWHVGDWREFAVLKHQEVCGAVAFSPDGQTLATSSGWEFGEVSLWRVEDGSFLRRMALDTAEEKAHPSAYLMPANVLVFSEDGRLLISGEYSGCKVWEVESGLLVDRWDFQNNSGGPGATAVRMDGRHLSYWDGGSLTKIDLEAGESVSNDLAYDAVEVLFLDQERVLVGSLHGDLELQGANGRQLWSARGLEQAMDDLAFQPGTHRLFGICDEGTIVEWDAPSGLIVRRKKTDLKETRGLVFLDGGRLLLHGTENGLALRDIEGLNLVKLLEGHQAAVREVETSSDEALAVTASNDGTVGVWDLKEGKLLRLLRGHEDMVVDVAFVGDSARAVSVSEDATVRLWDLETGEELARYQRPGRKTPYSAVAVSPDGKTLAVAEAFLNEQPVVVWDVPSGSILQVLDLGGAMDLKFTPRGGLWACDLSGNLTLWEPREGLEVARLKGFSGYGWALASSDDGVFQAMASTGQEKAVRIWKKRTD